MGLSSAERDNALQIIMLSLQLCIGLNNMHHVRKALTAMPNSMELDKYYEWLDKEEGIGEKVLIIII